MNRQTSYTNRLTVLNSADIPYRNFKVLEPDPHRFDGNNDGIGCQG